MQHRFWSPARSGIHGSPRAVSVVSVVLACAALVSPAAAQDPQQPPPPGPEVAGPAEQAGEPAPAAAQDAAPAYARVTVDAVPLRCFPSDRSPVFDDAVRAGQILTLGKEAQNGFREVILPLGPTGYVHGRFVSAPDDSGFVRTSGERVSFRYRPQSGEAPVATLDRDVALHAMGPAADDQWWIVRSPSTPCWVPESAIEAIGADGAAEAAVAAAALEVARRGEWEQATAARAAAAKAAAELAARAEELRQMVAGFRTEAQKPWQEQSRDAYAAMEASLRGIKDALPPESTEALTAASLAREIEKQKLMLDAQVVAAATLPPSPEAEKTTPPAVEDPLARFDLVGWVRVVSSAMPSRSVRLMRGGRVLGYLICTDERYDLPRFDGVEVGVIGAKDASAADGAWLIDVHRLEVLSVER